MKSTKLGLVIYISGSLYRSTTGRLSPFFSLVFHHIFSSHGILTVRDHWVLDSYGPHLQVRAGTNRLKSWGWFKVSFIWTVMVAHYRSSFHAGQTLHVWSIIFFPILQGKKTHHKYGFRCGFIRAVEFACSLFTFACVVLETRCLTPDVLVYTLKSLQIKIYSTHIC